MPDTSLRKWYFAVNEKGFETSRALLTLSIRSCLAHTALRPICLYNGSDPQHIAALEALGAEVLPHRSSLEDVLRRGYGDQYETYSGHWLRVDIPLIERDDPFVLYTDIDVMFLRHPQSAPPRTLAAAPERYRWRWPHFNSGVMVLNIDGMRKAHAGFCAVITKRMARGWSPPGHDQVSYNQYFRFRHSRLPATMNWKPYWGLNPDAQIVHFHGPKPANIETLKAGGGDKMMPIYGRLHALAPEAYETYCAMARGYS